LRERQLAGGDYIGTMDELRERTGYARSTISEAVRLLRDRGRIEIRPGRNGGLFVARANGVVRLRHTLLTVRGEAAAVADALVVREALEGLVDADAARFRSRTDVADLRKLITVMRRAIPDVTGFMRANWTLHERIAQITPNELLKGVYLDMTRCVADLSAHAEPDDPATERIYRTTRFDIHAELVAAIIAQDLPRTARAVAVHAGEGDPEPV
jgi:GntR family transcriptional repressor for pyruvate dehydrogenase complex